VLGAARETLFMIDFIPEEKFILPPWSFWTLIGHVSAVTNDLSLVLALIFPSKNLILVY
jgi:hypothetical protein